MDSDVKVVIVGDGAVVGFCLVFESTIYHLLSVCHLVKCLVTT